jgi:hypothetical protein
VFIQLHVASKRLRAAAGIDNHEAIEAEYWLPGLSILFIVGAYGGGKGIRHHHWRFLPGNERENKGKRR